MSETLPNLSDNEEYLERHPDAVVDIEHAEHAAYEGKKLRDEARFNREIAQRYLEERGEQGSPSSQEAADRWKAVADSLEVLADKKEAKAIDEFYKNQLDE